MAEFCPVLLLPLPGTTWGRCSTHTHKFIPSPCLFSTAWIHACHTATACRPSCACTLRRHHHYSTDISTFLQCSTQAQRPQPVAKEEGRRPGQAGGRGGRRTATQEGRARQGAQQAPQEGSGAGRVAQTRPACLQQEKKGPALIGVSRLLYHRVSYMYRGTYPRTSHRIPELGDVADVSRMYPGGLR